MTTRQSPRMTTRQAAAGRAPAALRAGAPRPVIQLISVTKTYGAGEASVQALRGVSLEVERA
jgi:hypothetical protein